MFLRPAAKEDMVQLRDIYNRYIDNAFVVPETDRLTETDMLERWQAIRKANLPFIVACQRGELIKARNKRFNGGEDMIMPDKVVGFACAADWSDGTCIYRPTVKLEVFVHMEQYMKHIGSCLADKMMSLLDPQFIERGGYYAEELERGDRVVSNVLVRYSYEAKKTDKLKWVSKWLKTRYGFEQVADLQGVAQKFDEQ
jgi:L-amino acid N-acyltransferase YncA